VSTRHAWARTPHHRFKAAGQFSTTVNGACALWSSGSRSLLVASNGVLHPATEHRPGPDPVRFTGVLQVSSLVPIRGICTAGFSLLSWDCAQP